MADTVNSRMVIPSSASTWAMASFIFSTETALAGYTQKVLDSSGNQNFTSGFIRKTDCIANHITPGTGAGTYQQGILLIFFHTGNIEHRGVFYQLSFSSKFCSLKGTNSK
jgi:hypothetical protein